MPDHRRRLAIAERRDQPHHIAHAIQQPERPEVVVVIGAPAGGAAIAAQIGRDDAIAGLRQRRHHLAPGIGDLRKAMQQHDQRPTRRFEPGLQHMDIEAVNVAHKAGADAGGQRVGVERRHRQRSLSRVRGLPGGSHATDLYSSKPSMANPQQTLCLSQQQAIIVQRNLCR